MCKLPTCKNVEVIEMVGDVLTYIHLNAEGVPLWMETIVKKGDNYKAIRYLPVDMQDAKEITRVAESDEED